jgi:hypothetical protein
MDVSVSESDQRLEVRKTLNLLARGINPVDGSPLDQGGCWHDPLVIRSLLFAADFLEQKGFHDVVLEKNSDLKLPDRAGKAWLTDEDDRLREAFYKHEVLSVLANRHKRSRGAILARLVHLRLVPDRNEARNTLGPK